MKKFILGMLSVIVFIPLAESIAEILCVLLEIPKGKLSASVLKINKQLQELQADQEAIDTQCIGFEYSPEEEYYEEDDDDDFEDKSKIKVGFAKS